MTFKPSWLTGALALCLSQASWAASEASASATLRFEAIDLITGEMAAFDYQPSLQVYSYGLRKMSEEGAGFEAFSSPFFAGERPGFPGQVVASANHVRLHAVADSETDRGSYDARLTLGSSNDSPYQSFPSMSGLITLAPHSSLTVFADVSLLAAALNPIGPESDFASASASMAITRPGTEYSYTSQGLTAKAFARSGHIEVWKDVPERYFDEDVGRWRWRLVDQEVFVPTTEESVSKNQTFMSVLVNDSGAVQYAHLGVYLSIKGWGQGPFATPVPEAGTLTMALAGSLLAVAAAARRRVANAPFGATSATVSQG